MKHYKNSALWLALCVNISMIFSCETTKDENDYSETSKSSETVRPNTKPIEVVIETDQSSSEVAPLTPVVTTPPAVVDVPVPAVTPVASNFFPPPFVPPFGAPIPFIDEPFHEDDDHHGDHHDHHDGDDHHHAVETLEVDVLVDLFGLTEAFDAFGNVPGPLGFLRDLTWVTLDGNPVPDPEGQLPLARGYEYFVAGHIYEKGALNDCLANPSEPCDPPANLRIGTWLCQGQTINDPNLTDIGDPMVMSHQLFTFTENNLEGSIATIGIEGNNFNDTVTSFPLAITGGTGEFSGITGQSLHRSLGPLGDFAEGNVTLILREKFQFRNIAKF